MKIPSGEYKSILDLLGISYFDFMFSHHVEIKIYGRKKDKIKVINSIINDENLKGKVMWVSYDTRGRVYRLEGLILNAKFGEVTDYLRENYQRIKVIEVGEPIAHIEKIVTDEFCVTKMRHGNDIEKLLDALFW